MLSLYKKCENYHWNFEIGAFNTMREKSSNGKTYSSMDQKYIG